MSHWVPALKGLKPHCCAMFQPSVQRASRLTIGRSSRPWSNLLDMYVHGPAGVHVEHLDVDYELRRFEALAGPLKRKVNAAERRCRRRVGKHQERDGRDLPEPPTAGADQKRTRMR